MEKLSRPPKFKRTGGFRNAAQEEKLVNVWNYPRGYEIEQKTAARQKKLAEGQINPQDEEDDIAMRPSLVPRYTNIELLPPVRNVYEIVQDLKNPLKDKILTYLYDSNSRFPARIHKQRIPQQAYSEKNRFEESDQLVFDDHRYKVPEQKKGTRSFGRMVSYQVDYWQFQSVYEGEFNNKSKPHGFGRMITSEAESVIGFFEKGAPSGLVLYIDRLYHKVFEGVVTNSPLNIENSCQPFKHDDTRISLIEPYDETKDCHELELRYIIKVEEFTRNMKLDNHQQFSEFNMRRMKYEIDNKYRKDKIASIQAKLKSKGIMIHPSDSKYTNELEYLENLEKMVDNGEFKSVCHQQ